jgi:hypothetical protein
MLNRGRAWRNGRIFVAAILVTLTGICGPWSRVSSAKPKHKPGPALTSEPTTEPFPIPADLNDLSLRATALTVLYELDLSLEQLRQLRTVASGAAESRPRAAAEGTDALADALKDLYEALLKGDDTDTIAELRQKVSELQDDDAVDLDDDVQPTPAARRAASLALKKIKASQLAAYISEHADELTDPIEQMNDALGDLRDGDNDDPDAEIEQTASEVGALVAGADAQKAKEIAGQVQAWLESGRKLTADEFDRLATTRAEVAKKIVGELDPLMVVGHWLDNNIAVFLSNPQLDGAIDALMAARAKGG